MSKYYILYNPLSCNKLGETKASNVKNYFPNDDLFFIDITSIRDFKAFFEGISANDNIVVCGGDGTLNKFINYTEGTDIKNEILYYATGSGNDFLRDMGMDKESKPISIKNEIENLPIVTVNNKSYRFLNGVGFGIDGYCCYVGDKERQKDSNKKINYTKIAIMGLLFHYKPTSAKVTVDGIEYKFKKVWLCPTMVGRYYGGGMMPTPMQTRDNKSKSISVLVFHGSSKLKTLMLFPSIFTGKHTNHKKHCTVLSGKRISVEFDSPTPLQIDGETIENVTKYDAFLSPCPSACVL